MVEYTSELDTIFGSLADPTRRDILERVAQAEYSISELVQQYQISFAAVSKHVKILEQAKLIIKRKEGKKHMVTIAPYALQSADEYLERYRQMWESRYNKLENLLNEKE